MFSMFPTTTYVNSFKPSLKDLKKLKILKRLKKNKDIIILRPDKGNGVVILDKLATIMLLVIC